MCFVFCGVPRVCLYICNCVIKNSFVLFFHSRGSDVSNGPGCRVGLCQGYVHGSLCICRGRLTNTMWSYWRCFPLPLDRFIFSVHLDYLGYLWRHLRPLIINNCNARIAPTKRTQLFVHIGFKKVQVDKDQEKAQTAKDSYSKNPRWEKTKLTIRYLYHDTFRKPNEQLFSQ